MAFSLKVGETYNISRPISRGWALYCSINIPAQVLISMEQLISSFTLISLAEMGDKTQLLSIILAARYKKFWPIFLGITAATLINHAASAYMGHLLASFINIVVMKEVTSVIMILLGVWMLIPDKAPETKEEAPKYGIFFTTVIVFFLAEMGDRTQIATVTLGAQYGASIFVILGTTLGMMAANAPAILFGDKLLKYLPLKTLRIVASLMFLLFGVVGLLNNLTCSPKIGPKVCRVC